MSATRTTTRVANIRKRLERLQGNSLRILAAAIDTMAENPEQVKADATLPKTQAPMYLHLAAAIASTAARKDEETGGTTNNMNVVVVGQAPSMEAWLEQVKRFQQAPKQQLAIDAKVVEKP